MIPQPWSHTALEKHENCPRQYYEENVKPDRVKVPATKEMLWGREVHKHFEEFLLEGAALPADLAPHGEFLSWFKARPGELAGEEDICLSFDLKACGKWDKQVWWRGVVDARKRFIPAGFTHLLDHKTGKKKNDFTQLRQFAIFEFMTQPEIHTIKAEYYWTQVGEPSGEVYTRAQLPDLWSELVPKLERYKRSFETDTWIPKRSGLCRGWCSVTWCEHWEPKRIR